VRTLKNAWRRWRKWSLPTRLTLSIGALGLFLGVAAWWWPDLWKRTADEGRDVPQHSTPPGSEWRERKSKDSFAFVFFDFPDATNTWPTSINDNGEIVGIYRASTGRRGFLRHRDGTFTSFEYPGAPSTTNATGLNNKGEIVGFYYDATKGRYGSPAHGFLRQRDGTFSSFDYPGTSQTIAHAINDKGEVVGAYIDDNGKWQGFLRHGDGSFSPIDYPGAASTVPTGINNRSEIIGHSLVPKLGDRGFLRRNDGTFMEIMPDPTTSASPKGINESGDLVGHTGLGPFLRRNDGTLNPLDHPACSGGSCLPTGINNRLEVVGSYHFSRGIRGFLASPMSE